MRTSPAPRRSKMSSQKLLCYFNCQGDSIQNNKNSVLTCTVLNTRRCLFDKYMISRTIFSHSGSDIKHVLKPIKIHLHIFKNYFVNSIFGYLITLTGFVICFNQISHIEKAYHYFYNPFTFTNRLPVGNSPAKE